MNKSSLKEDIIREMKLAHRRKAGMTGKIIESVVEFQFAYVRQVIEAGQYEGVRLPYFGKFYTTIQRVKHVTNEAFRRKREQGNCQSGTETGS